MVFKLFKVYVDWYRYSIFDLQYLFLCTACVPTWTAACGQWYVDSIPGRPSHDEYFDTYCFLTWPSVYMGYNRTGWPEVDLLCRGKVFMLIVDCKTGLLSGREQAHHACSGVYCW